MIFPLNSSPKSIVLKHNGIIKDTRNISNNVPVVNITSLFTGQTFTNQIINITWTASDADGDLLNYAVLFSSNNGSTYNTIIFDHNTTSFNVSSNDLSDCALCRIKVLATDSVNTNSSISNTFSIDNDLNITEFKVIYQNNTERIFKIDLQNTFTNTNINNVSWEFNTGNGIKTYQKLFNLASQEKIFVYIYHNYSASGNYNLTFKAFSGNYIESETISINV